MFCFFFHCFSTENKEKGGRKASGKTRDTTAGNRGQTSFHRSNCLISGRVTSEYELTVTDYINPNEVAY